jgi:hypothetical protein
MTFVRCHRFTELIRGTRIIALGFGQLAVALGRARSERSVLLLLPGTLLVAKARSVQRGSDLRI